MKWKSRGKEFDTEAYEIMQKYDITRDFYIFGAGEVGHKYSKLLSICQLFGGYIDNNRDKTDDINVFFYDDFFRTRDKGWIILCASDKQIKEMKKQLRNDTYGKQFYVYDYSTFFQSIYPVLTVYICGRSVDRLCQISVTERCTLKCEKCAHGCWNVSMDKEDLDLEEVKASADYYFSAYDFVEEFVLIGGEPFLYKHMAESIRYIGDHYRNRIIIFAITTNGTIIPTEEVIKACKKYDVHIHISNYVKTIPAMKNRYEKLCGVLEKNGISYDLSNEDDQWVDYGFDSLVRTDEEDLESVFDKCKTPCREVRGNKYYFCVQARAVGENLSFEVDDDYFDLSQIKSDEDKKALMEFGMGYSDKGYLDMCKYCYGAEALERVIPRAVQKRNCNDKQ